MANKGQHTIFFPKDNSQVGFPFFSIVAIIFLPMMFPLLLLPSHLTSLFLATEWWTWDQGLTRVTYSPDDMIQRLAHNAWLESFPKIFLLQLSRNIAF